MKWTAQYNFMDLYKKKNGPFDPDANIELSLIFSPIENVIILGAQKDTPKFDPTATERQAVLYISTDRGQSYKELILEGNDVYDIAAYTKEYSIICTSDYKFEYVYLLNHKTFEIKEIDKYNRDDEIYYDDFDGRFLKCEKNEIRFLADVLSKDSVKLYEIPKKLTAYQYYPIHYYKDFICDYTRLHAHSELRFSFDKGKTWKTHKIPMAGLLVFNKNVGFFEDKYIIFEGILFRGGGDDSGGRIMVGEFQK